MCRFSRSFIAEKNLVNHKKQGISHQITVSFISPNAEPHVHEPRKAGSSHQMISYRDPGPLGIKTVDIQEVGRFLTPSRSHTIVQERSDTFSHSCTFHRHTVLDFFPRWCTSMQQPTTQHNTTQHTTPTTSLALSAPTPILGLSNMLDKPRIKVGTERAKLVVGLLCCVLCCVL